MADYMRDRDREKDSSEMSEWLDQLSKSFWAEIDEYYEDDKEPRHPDGFFPWKDVNACMSDRIPAPRDASELSACPGCDTPAEKLTWIRFRSPDWTWRDLCGRAGPLAFCDHCRRQIHFLLDMMN